MADGEVKERDETLIGINQRMANQKDPLQMVTEVILPEMIKVNKDALDVAKRDISKETVWQKISTCIMRRRAIKMLI